MIDMDAILEKLKNHKYWNRIVNDDTIAVVVCGSRRLGIVDDRSDYDLIVIQHIITYEDKITEYLMCNGKKIHWYYRQPSDYLDFDENTYQWILYSMCTTGFLNEETILYVNSQYAHEWEAILEHCNKCKEKICRLYFNKQRKRIDKIVNQGEIREEDYTKFLYQYCVVSYVLFNEIMTEADKQLLGELKRIRWQSTSNECKNYCVVRLQRVKEKLWADNEEEDLNKC